MKDAMTRAELEHLLPDYLGGELDAAMHARFERSLQAHTDLRAEAESLGDAIGVMRRLEERPLRSTVAPPHPRINRSALIVRYAAIITVAFTLGYFVRGGNQAVRNSSEVAPPLAAVDTANRTAPRTELEERLAEGYSRGGSAGTTLGQSLIALAHAASTTPR